MKQSIEFPHGDIFSAMSREEISQTLDSSTSITMFDAVIVSFKKKRTELPENVKELEKRCLERNIETLAGNINSLECFFAHLLIKTLQNNNDGE